MIVVFPAPVGPTRAIVCPGAARSEKSFSTGFARLIAESDLIENNFAADLFQGRCLRRIADRWGGILHFKDPFGAGQGRLQMIVEHGDAAHGAEEVHDVDDESGQDADRDEILERKPAAEEDCGGDGDRAHGCEHRAEGGGDDIGLDAGAAVGIVDLRKLRLGILGAGESLHDANPGDVFFADGIQRAEVELDLTEGDAAAAGDQARDQQHERDQNQGADCQAPVKQEHGNHDPGQLQEIGNELRSGRWTAPG